ncbi:M1 family metallopeptidase [Streptomyces alanosinicus]|uniref:Aminopeptidase N n=1 Tax=Streptomyces alanosinicus TaxID=68171 RepID=A0A918YDD3_9ACTN|nr:M1 family metallopeptidase [Streptomyces alanosinicus]GHE00127.1 metallopeptidase [Streptomyces alanosinicus]
MSRSVRLVPAAAALLALTLTATACKGGVHGTPGGSGVRDPYFPKAGNGGYDVGHYDLTLDYTPAGRRLTGTAVITARATQDLSAFNLDLAGLDVDSVTVEGKKALFSRAGQELTVRPHDDLSKGETFRTTVRYSGRPRTLTDPDGSEEGWVPTGDGALGLGEPVGSMAWFPGNNHPSDKATYDLRVTVPKGLAAVSNGELAGQTTKGGRTTFHWHTAEPMATYLATVAIGHYDIARSTGPHGLPILTAVDSGQAEDSKDVLKEIPGIIDWEEINFGPYPFSSTGAIVTPPSDAGYALETQNRPVFPADQFDTETVVHELAHQWYGDSVTPKSWQDMWLNEGFATYAEWLYREDHGGKSAQQTFMDEYNSDDEAIWAFPPAKPSSAAHISDSPVYQRGAMILQKIRQKVGDDTFYDIIQGWAAARRHGSANTADFTAFVEKKAPDHDFTEIWKDWLYGDGKPAHP